MAEASGGTAHGGSSFVHLHTHTEYSMLDGAARIAELVGAAVADGQPALAITDHGNMYGVLDFYKACREARHHARSSAPRPTWRRESRHERPVRRGSIDDTGGDAERGEKLYYHLTVLAETTRATATCIKLSSAAYLEGYYYKPRRRLGAARALPRRPHRHDRLPRRRRRPGPAAPTTSSGRDALPGRLQDIFGRDNLFVELQDHGLDAAAQDEPGLVEIARRIGAPLLATNDSHYCRREDAVAHDALLVRADRGRRIDDPKRFKFEGQEHYLKTAAEMRQLFAELPEACDNTLLVAERANVEHRARASRPPAVPGARRLRRDTYEESAAGYLAPSDPRGRRGRYGRADPGRGGRAARLRAEASSPRWVSRPTSSSCGTSSATPASRGSGSARAAAQRRAAASPTACGSSTSTRSVTTCSSSVSSTPAASRCPTSTWTSTSAAAAR